MSFVQRYNQTSGLWSYDDTQSFYNGLNHCFIYNVPLEFWWNTISSLYMKTIPLRQIVAYGNYYLSELSFHNNSPWTESEHSLFMQMYELYNLDFTQYAIVMTGKRSLMDIHEHAMKTLPNFRDMAYLYGNDSALTTGIGCNALYTEQSSVSNIMDMTCNEHVWAENSALSNLPTENEDESTVSQITRTNITSVSDKIFGDVNEIEDNLTLSQFTDPDVMDLSQLEEECNEDVMREDISYNFNDIFDNEIDIASVFHNETSDTLTCYCVSAVHCVCDQGF